MDRRNILFHIFNKIPSQGIIHFFGPPGGGINTLMLQIIVYSAENNRVIYIDNERLFSAKRLKQIARDPQILEKVVIFPCSSTSEQLEIVDDIEVLGFTEKPNIQIIISDIFRYRHYTEEGLQDLEILTHTLARLRELSKKNKKTGYYLKSGTRKWSAPLFGACYSKVCPIPHSFRFNTTHIC